MEHVINKVIEKINSSEVVYIAGHINPDGDAVGACFATAHAICLLGKKPVILLGEYAEKYNILDGARFLYKGDISLLEPELFISVDTSEKERLGAFKQVFDRSRVTVNIDHHMTNPFYADINYIIKDASSACEVVYNVFSKYVEITKPMAEALYSGMVSDTGCFRHKSTSPSTMVIAARLMETGINFSMLQRELIYAHSIPEIMIFRTALNNMKFSACGKIVYTSISKADFNACGATVSDLDGIVEYILNIRNACVSVLFSERSGHIKASFRSVDTDMGLFAGKYGGGGHKCAAGAEICDGLSSVVNLVIKDLEKLVCITG